MLRRQKPGESHVYPEHRKGIGGILRRLLWKLGFDPLTVYERLGQVDYEREYWKEIALRPKVEMTASGTKK